jgi:hypothetical protein
MATYVIKILNDCTFPVILNVARYGIRNHEYSILKAQWVFAA